MVAVINKMLRQVFTTNALNKDYELKKQENKEKG